MVSSSTSLLLPIYRGVIPHLLEDELSGEAHSGSNELSFTTGAGSKVNATQINIGVFEGRIVNGDDYNKKITIANEDATKQLALVPKKPDSNVPASCAVFFGSWKGRWTQWQIPEEKLLHVTEVTSQCGVKFFYYPDTRYTTNYPGTSEIRDGSISFLCNKADNGTCTFKIHGDELWVGYTGTSGTNGGVFKKQQ